MSITIGSKAPDFTLKNSDGNEITLSTFMGKKNVLVLFFPLAFTGVCTAELCSTRDALADYNSMNAEVLAISVDSFFTLKQFKEANKLNFELLSDFNKKTATAYGALYNDFFGMTGVAKRSAFVVDKEGIVHYAEVLEVAKDLPNFSAIQEVLKRLN
ncbi:MAG: redoxin domain-containing protein [Bacteroidetes bacterium]|nr:redoxin domain-containing protein [Bacteroidota bacterium]